MPKPDKITLPQQALDHLPEPAKAALADNPAITDPDPPNIVRGDPSVNYESLSGTAGVQDIFVFDAAGAVSFRADLIYGFEPGLDQIAYVNIPSDNPWQIPDSYQALPDRDDPNIADWSSFLFVDHGGPVYSLVALTIDATPQLSDYTVYLNDPFMIA